MSLCGGLIVCTLAALCVALLPAARRRGWLKGHQIFMCGNSSIQHVHFQFPLGQFNFYQAESILSLLKLLFCLYTSPSPHFTPFISTPIAHPHSISPLKPYNLALLFLYCIALVRGFHSYIFILHFYNSLVKKNYSGVATSI